MREGDVSVDGLEGELQFDYESLNCEDMEFEPQTYFSLSELLASDDDGQVDGNNVTEDGSGSWENTSCSITHDGYSVELILLKKSSGTPREVVRGSHQKLKDFSKANKWYIKSWEGYKLIRNLKVKHWQKKINIGDVLDCNGDLDWST